MAYFVGIAIGGTFTDAVLLDWSGTARLLKTPITPQDPAVGVNNALALAEEGLGFRDIILRQRGMGLWTGRELHEIMHFSRRRPPEPVVERPLIREVTERVDYKDAVVTPLDEDDARAETRDTSRQEHSADGY